MANLPVELSGSSVFSMQPSDGFILSSNTDGTIEIEQGEHSIVILTCQVDLIIEWLQQLKQEIEGR